MIETTPQKMTIIKHYPYTLVYYSEDKQTGEYTKHVIRNLSDKIGIYTKEEWRQSKHLKFLDLASQDKFLQNLELTTTINFFREE